jgi:hypothetical protein
MVTQDPALVGSRPFLTEGRVRSNSGERAENANGIPGAWEIRGRPSGINREQSGTGRSAIGKAQNGSQT